MGRVTEGTGYLHDHDIGRAPQVTVSLDQCGCIVRLWITEERKGSIWMSSSTKIEKSTHSLTVESAVAYFRLAELDFCHTKQPL